MNGIDGWAPATYLKQVSPQKNAQLQREYDKKMKDEEKRRITEQLQTVDPDTNGHDMASNALKDELIATATSFAKRMKERADHYNHIGTSQAQWTQMDDLTAPQIAHSEQEQQAKKGTKFVGDYKYDENTDSSSLVSIAICFTKKWHEYPLRCVSI